MQCSSPLFLSNNKLSYTLGIDKPVVSVTCGKCLSCQQMQQNEWILRAFWHWKEYTEKLNGMVFFVTLTYSDDSIPYIVSYDTNILGEQVNVTELVRGKPNQWLIDNSNYCFSCFNKKDVDKFFNSVRQHFLRKYGINNINYLVCSEYGSQFSCRSHHHILVFVPDVWLMYPVLRNNDVVSKCRQIFEYYWTHVQKNGWTIYSKVEKGGALVSSPVAIKYVGKYVTKDLNFWSNKDIKLFFSQPDNKHDFRNALPRHYQSKGFGKHLADYILDDCDKPVDLLLDGFTMPVNGKQKMPYNYPIPNYIRRKLMYDTIYEKLAENHISKKYVKPKQSQKIFPNYRRQKRIVVRTKVRHGKTLYRIKDYLINQHTYIVPNENYYKFNVLALGKKLERCVSKLDLNLTTLGLCAYFPQISQFESFVKRYTLYDGEMSYPAFLDWLKDKIKGYTTLDLAIYKLVYRGVVPTTQLDVDYLGKYKENYDVLLRNKIHCKYWQKSLTSSKSDKEKVFSYLEPFDKFELVLSLFDRMEQERSDRISRVCYDRLLQMKKTKQLFQPL